MSIYQEEHSIFQQSISRFSEKEVLPYVDSWEKDGNFPSSIFKTLGDQGFLGMRLGEEWGGVDGDYYLAGAWCEEFGRIPAVGFTVAVNMHALVITPTVQKFCTPELKKAWIPKAIAGEAIGAYAFTEPGAGSDLSSIRTKAVADGDDYVINGSKIFITNGARAHFVLVLAQTDPTKGYDGYSTFLVDTSLPGFSVSRKLDKLGWHCSDTAELNFVDVRVSKSALLGELNKGWYQAMQSLEWERLMLTLGAIGGAEQCIKETITYINDRKVFGKSVGSFDHSRELLADLWSKLQAGRSFAHHCLKLLQEGERCRREVSLVKLFVCELAITIADRCLQLHGGYGYTTEFPPERWLRDLRLNTIGGGTTEIMAQVAVKELLR